MRSTIFASALFIPAALALATQFATAAPTVRPQRALEPAASSVVPQIPSWVRPGLGVTYVAYSAFISGGRYVDPIELTVTSHVKSATKTDVSGTTRTQTLGTKLVSNYTWACTNLGLCRGGDWQFWVDPKNPTGSIVGPEGERFAIAGRGRYTDPWKRTWTATLLNYQNNNNGVRFTIAFDSTSGLILYNVQSYPTEYIVEYYYS